MAKVKGPVEIIVLLSALALTVPCAAQNYTFTNITDSASNGAFSHFRLGGVSDSGTASFISDDFAGHTEVETGNGGPLTVVDNGAAFINGFGEVRSSNAGTVVFDAGPTNSSSVVYAVNGTSRTLIASSGGNITNVGYPRSSSAGVVFDADLSGGGEAIYYGNGGPLTLVAQTGAAFQGLSDVAPSINSAGTVAFEATSASNANMHGIYTYAGGVLTTVFANAALDDPTINSNGDVAFRGNSEIYRASGGVVTPVATIGPTFNGFGDFNTATQTVFNTPGIADNGTVVFGAQLSNGTDGLFTGTDPIADKVIEAGDPLFGSTLLGFSFEGGVSGDGNITFLYALTNGVDGVAVASPVPEPSFAALLLGSIVLLRRRSEHRRPAIA